MGLNTARLEVDSCFKTPSSVLIKVELYVLHIERNRAVKSPRGTQHSTQTAERADNLQV